MKFKFTNLPRTQEEAVEEYKKCKSPEGITYFVSKYCIIKSEAKLMKFDLYSFQKPIIQAWANNENTVINKARQLGLSTLVAAFCVWKMLFYSNQDITVISENSKKAKALLRKVKLMIDNMPSFLSQKIKVDNIYSMEFHNGSRIESEGKTPNAGRSETLTFLVVDEAAHIDKNIIDEIWTSASPTLSTTNGNVAIISTPNGLGGWFYNMFEGAKNLENDFTFFEIPWHVHPKRDEIWKLQELKNLNNDMRKFEQEYNCNFVASGDTVFDIEWLMKYTENTIIEPIEIRGVRDPNANDLWIFQKPNPSSQYLITGDPSRGDAADYHGLHVIELYTLEPVAEYRGKCTTLKFAELIKELTIEYNNAAVTVENNGVGWAVIQELVRLGGINLIQTHKHQIAFDPHRIKKDFSSKANLVYGFSMTANLRILAIEALCGFVNEEEFPIRSRRLFTELKTFAYINGKAQAMDSTCHDDLILSLAQGLYVYQTYILKKERDKKRLQAMLSSIEGKERQKDTSSINKVSDKIIIKDPRLRKKLEDTFKQKIDRFTTLDTRDFLK